MSLGLRQVLLGVLGLRTEFRGTACCRYFEQTDFVTSTPNAKCIAMVHLAVLIQPL